MALIGSIASLAERLWVVARDLRPSQPYRHVEQASWFFLRQRTC